MSTGSFSDGDDDALVLAKLDAEEKEYAAQLEALQAEQATTSALPHTVAAGDLAAENARLKAQLAALESASAVKSTSRRESKLSGPKAELAKLEAKNAALAEALASGDGLSKLTTLKAAAASKARSAALSSSLNKSSIAHSEMKSALRDLETREKGVDICMLMDGTGSMACVIYRDFCDGARRLETADFVGKQDLGRITSFLSGVYADGGGDECEDVAGGLKEALKLSWKSSTKLLIHFGDAPAHGSKYHNGRANDDHIAGCPHGNVPERYVKQLCSNRVNYYFAQINSSTERMTEIFAKEYEHSQNAVFKVLDRSADATTFIPLVVESIRDSMRRSAFFGSGKRAGSSAKTAKPDPRTVFHSIL